MKTILNLKAVSILAGCILALPLTHGFSAVVATIQDGDPSDYAPTDLGSAQKSLSGLDDLAAAGDLTPSSIPTFNSHRAEVTLQAPSAAQSRHPVLPPLPIPPKVAITRVDNAGVISGKETLQISGAQLQKVSQWTIDCGEAVSAPVVASKSASVVVLTIDPILLDRSCVLNGSGLKATNGVTFNLYGLTCAEWSALCSPAAPVSAYDTKATDGSPIHIEIRNGPLPGDVFTDADVAGIKAQLARMPADQLKNVHAIQYKSDFSSYIAAGTAGNGGVIYIGNRQNLAFSGWDFPIPYGVGELLYSQFSAAEKDFWSKNIYGGWDQAKAFGVYFMDWDKSTTDLLHNFGSVYEILRSNPNAYKASQITSIVQSALTMLTHFYNPKTKTAFMGYLFGDANVSFTKTSITIKDVVFNLDAGGNIISQSNIATPTQRVTYPTPIPVPVFFTQTVPRT